MMALHEKLGDHQSDNSFWNVPDFIIEMISFETTNDNLIVGTKGKVRG